MHLHLAVADATVNTFSLLALGGVGGILAGLFCTGGGFLLTPLLIIFGIPPAVATASVSSQIVAASASGALAHKRMGNVDVKMSLVYLTGALFGGTAGTQVVRLLCDCGQYDTLVRLFYVGLLTIVGGFTFYESFTALRGCRRVDMHVAFQKLIGRLPWQMEFEVSGVRASVLVIIALGALVGFLAAMLGIGGGFITIPLMIYLLGVPTLVAVGTGLFQILLTSINVTFLQAVTNHSVDIVLAIVLCSGTVIGAQVGAILSRFFRPEQLRLVFSLVILAVMFKFLLGLFSCPGNLGLLIKGGC